LKHTVHTKAGRYDDIVRAMSSIGWFMPSYGNQGQLDIVSCEINNANGQFDEFDTLSDWVVWSIVEQSSKQIGIEHFGAHDLRRTCAKLCRKSGGDLEQIKFLLGHSSIQTTERYLGSDQEIVVAVNDNLGL
jgi:Phage integrase family